uniref:protein-tyrosine-phosphatase n=1 Tax=Ananas comosus var. bracteatus TaxID=296719 RepID=A0A6V7PJM3_ANACO|nr:unnamed protein product [Ananas comosus var. bracteatus]
MDENGLISSDNGEVSSDNVKEQPRNVYIWDMDETLILLRSLLDGSYAGAFHGLKDTRKGVEIGKQWENHILQICDDYFFYEEIENYNEPFLNSLTEYDDGRDLSNYDFENDGFTSPFDDSNKRKLAYRHRSIAEKYAKGVHDFLDQQTIKSWNDLYSSTDSYTDGWLSSAHALLEEVVEKNKVPTGNGPVSAGSKSQNINVLVTSGSLIPSLAKCLLYRLDDVIPCDNHSMLKMFANLIPVYSSWEVGKLQCFRWIKARFDGPKVRFCVIGDGLEECEAARLMNWPFVKVDFRPMEFIGFRA